MAKEKAKNLRLCIEIKPSCSLHSLQCRSTLAMRGRHVQVSTGVRRTCRASFLFWWGQMSFFCIEPLRLAVKTKDIHSVLILFLESAKFTEKWNPVFILILASSTHFYSACISIYMNIFFSSYWYRVEFKLKVCLEYCLRTHARKCTYRNSYLFEHPYYTVTDTKLSTLLSKNVFTCLIFLSFTPNLFCFISVVFTRI